MMIRHGDIKLDLDWLKANHVRLYYFGLGFIQLKIDETYRLHFYTSKLPAFNEDIHNHRYHFTSTVLKGEITNHYYALDEKSEPKTHRIQSESCNPDINAPSEERLVCVKQVSSETYRKGQTYGLNDKVFHTVKAVNCVTLLERSGYIKEFAQVVTPLGQQSTCPFSKKVSEKELWGIIAGELK